MTSSKSKQTGTYGETGVVRALLRLGIVAMRTPPLGGADQGDLLSRSVCWQVKAGEYAATASLGLIREWLDETMAQTERADRPIGILITKRTGFSPARADHWWAYLPTAALIGMFGDVNLLTAFAHPMEPVRMTLYQAVDYLKVGGYA